MFLTPSKILYTHRDPEICCSTERSFTEMAKYVHGSTVFPKLQVVKKDGFYFTLNDAKLQVYRHLEKMGRCGSVEVEKVSLKEVPEGIRKLMTAPDILPRYKEAHTIFSEALSRYEDGSLMFMDAINSLKIDILKGVDGKQQMIMTLEINQQPTHTTNNKTCYYNHLQNEPDTRRQQIVALI